MNWGVSMVLENFAIAPARNRIDRNTELRRQNPLVSYAVPNLFSGRLLAGREED